jgi:putative two-component system response regulator
MIADTVVRNAVRVAKGAFMEGAYLGPYPHIREITLGHSQRVSQYVGILVGEMSIKGWGGYLTRERRSDYQIAALLHDLGKFAIPPEILSKQGIHSEKETTIMREHTIKGHSILQDIEMRFKTGRMYSSPSKPLLAFVEGCGELFLLEKVVAAHHHERWDGQGYPEGLKAEKIPLSARIVAVADVYDALTSERPYRQIAHPHEIAAYMIESLKGSQLDPNVVEAFERVEQSFKKTLKRFSDAK